jgi:hypothetical protein
MHTKISQLKIKKPGAGDSPCNTNYLGAEIRRMGVQASLGR